MVKPYVLRRLILLVIALVIYAWAFEWLGFPIATSLLTISILYYLVRHQRQPLFHVYPWHLLILCL